MTFKNMIKYVTEMAEKYGEDSEMYIKSGNTREVHFNHLVIWSYESEVEPGKCLHFVADQNPTDDTPQELLPLLRSVFGEYPPAVK